MSKSVWHQLLIASVTALIFFTNLGGAHLWDDDEARHGACALAMYDRHDAIVPMFNGELSTDKPILMYWCMLLGMNLFGTNEFAIRFCSAVFAIGTALTTYHLGRMLFRPVIGLWAGLIMATTFYFGFTCRAATPDSLLVFWTTLGLTLFVRATFGRPSEQPIASSTTTIADLLPQRWSDWAFMYAAFAVGILAKGPVGLVLPGVIIGIYVLMSADRNLALTSAADPSLFGAIRGWFRKVFDPRRIAIAFWAMRPFTAVLLVALIAAPWYIEVAIQTNGEWVSGFFWRHHLNRFVEPMESHRGPIFYYIPALLAGVFPWSIFLPLALWRGMQTVYQSRPQRRVAAFLLCWFAVYFCFFSLAATKLPNYLLPAFPALAVLVGAYLQNWIERPVLERRLWMRAAFGALAVVGLATSVGLYQFVDRFLPNGRALAWIGVAPCVGGLAGFLLMERQRYRASVALIALTGVVLSVSIFGFAQLKVDSYQNTASLINSIRRQAGEDFSLTTYNYLPSSLVYYSRRTVAATSGAIDLSTQLLTNPDRYLLVPASDLAKVQAGLPSDYVVLSREPRFLKTSDELLLLGRPVRNVRRDAAAPR